MPSRSGPLAASSSCIAAFPRGCRWDGPSTPGTRSPPVGREEEDWLRESADVVHPMTRAL
ncbi:MAG TPA: hypothetical protein PLA94_04000 [Myxococcota bacterium]|nr:hypothetical protein [Myxococcota bacterium]